QPSKMSSPWVKRNHRTRTRFSMGYPSRVGGDAGGRSTAGPAGPPAYSMRENGPCAGRTTGVARNRSGGMEAASAGQPAQDGAQKPELLREHLAGEPDDEPGGEEHADHDRDEGQEAGLERLGRPPQQQGDRRVDRGER